MKIILSFVLIFVFGLAGFGQSVIAGPEMAIRKTDKQQKQAQLINKINQIKIYFKTDSVIVAAESRKNLMSVADSFRQLPANTLMEISSYTDGVENKGDRVSSIKLSEARSDAVKNELVKLGVNVATVTVKGFGSAQPVADNATPVGRALNRRTEFRIVLIDVSSNKTTPVPSTSEPVTEPCPNVDVLRYRMKKFSGENLFPQGDKDFGKPTDSLDKQHLVTVEKLQMKLRLYDCRHTFATRAVETGVDLLTLSQILGHSSLRMVTRYSHPSENFKAEAIKRMEKAKIKNQSKSSLKAAISK